MNRICAIAVGASLALGSLASAAAWSPAAGTNGNLNYSNGQDINGLFGNPAVGEEKFVFVSPSAFGAVAPGSPSSSTDTASVTASTNPGETIQKVSVRVEGDYLITNSPASLTYSGTLNIDGDALVVPLTFVPPSPIGGDGQGQFIGTAEAVLPVNVTVVNAALTFTVSASASGIGTAEMQSLNAEIAFTTIPEPATLGALAAASGLLLRRRRA